MHRCQHFADFICSTFLFVFVFVSLFFYYYMSEQFDRSVALVLKPNVFIVRTDEVPLGKKKNRMHFRSTDKQTETQTCILVASPCAIPWSLRTVYGAFVNFVVLHVQTLNFITCTLFYECSHFEFMFLFWHWFMPFLLRCFHLLRCHFYRKANNSTRRAVFHRFEIKN